MSGSSTHRSTSGIPQPPLASYGILKTAIGGDKFDKLSQQELSDRVYDGLLLKLNEGQGEQHQIVSLAIAGLCLQGQHHTHKYWVDRRLNKSCWIVLAPALSIDSVNDSNNWTWKEEQEECYGGNGIVRIAKIKRVSWVAISGTCKTTTLSPKTAYQVEIIVKMSEESDGWEAPVNLSLSLPDGHKQERVEYLKRKRRDSEPEPWQEITIGTFETTPRTVGEISFSLKQTGGHWKSGLLVKGVQLRPLA
ncbi:protein PHLOEM PROTEIN 2-LIKE A1-like [Rhodamnia argentea]|uniref:Protein PHLOEM PROTEIN 2-LIKE A1-like n=1 Tax=Rhodamnia argentea TaxID=178133 RepID=A0ABM3HSL3_9MYRT|nr:protein PHLOEM PROTEIN 2-LIKE A1-like [Rhodamnia argentea]